MKKTGFAILAVLLLVNIFLQLRGSPVNAQAASPGITTLVYATALSTCAWPTGVGTAPTGGAICVYPGGLGVSTVSAGTPTAFTAVSGGSAVTPATQTSAAGVCLTGYNATTGAWTTSPCVNSVNSKSGTASISATTTLQ